MNAIYSYVCAKRLNQSFCFLLEPSDSILRVKKNISAAMLQHDADNDTACPTGAIRLLLPSSSSDHSKVLQDDDSLQAAGIKDNDVLHFVLAVSDTEFESVNIASTQMQDTSAS